MKHTDTKTAALIGAFVADAASLSAHWIYNTDIIKNIANDNGGQAAFADRSHADIPPYHTLRPSGGGTQYGEVLGTAIRAINAQGGAYDVSVHQENYTTHFNAGGKYCGYIDRPTRGTLANIAAGKLDPSGIDDDQLPAIAALPALVVTGQSVDAIENAIQVTNVNADASAYGQTFAALLSNVLKGDDLLENLTRSAENAPTHIKPALQAALSTPETNSIAYGEVTKRACHLPMAMPLAFHILKHSTSYAHAVETNILAGGDSAGRAIIIGAVMGAKHGFGGQFGIPLDWLLKLQGADTLMADCKQLLS